MRHLLRFNTMAAVIGMSLAGAAWHSSLQAGQLSVAPSSAPTASTSPSTAAESYIVEFIEPGLLHYKGGTAGIAATAPLANAQSRKLNVHSDASRAYDSYLQSQRAVYINEIQHSLGRNVDVTHSYSVTLNGLAAEMTGAEAASIAQIPGVKSVRPAGVEYLNTYRGPKFIGADKIWDGSATPSNVGTKGQGIVVGILDGGSNSAHPSFANDAACGFSLATPKLIAKDCSASAGGVCTGTTPEATAGSGGHGVHTASTVAGNTIDNTAVPTPALPNGVSMSGVAPCAAIRQYKVCPGTTCGGAAILAGIQNAISDQVDVINFSISGGTSPWSDNDRQFLDAVNADVFVAASAGNTRDTQPDPVGQVNHRGPWVMSVAASTQDLIIGPSLSVVGPGTPPVETQGVPINPGSTTTSTPTLAGSPIKSSTTNVEGCTATGAFPTNYFAGSIAVVRRGTCAFTEKINNAAAAGAVLVVIGNNTVGSINMDTTGAAAVPAFSTSQVAGNALIAFANANATATANVSPVGQASTQSDVIAGFSFRGPTPGVLADLTKPDITGPGVDIYAATDPASGQYEFMSGTSMSGPHIAGSAALMRAVHPTWTVQEVKSALQTTASIPGFMEDGTTPWNSDIVGSGRVDLNKAAKAGLVLDETYARFVAANPSGGTINIKTLNLPAVRNLNCTPSCTFSRTVTNKLSTAGTWSSSFTTTSGIRAVVSPSTFTIPSGGSQVLDITVAPPAETAMTAIGFGHLLFSEAASQSPTQHFTVAIRGTGDDTPIGEDDLIFKDGFDTGGVVSPPVTYSHDDGSYENGIAWTDGTPAVEYASLFLNRFTPAAADFPLNLNNIKIMWPTNTSGSVVGKQATVLVYHDADGDGDPRNAVLVTQSNVTIAALDVFETYPVTASIASGGDIYIGFQDTWALAPAGFSPALYPAAIDQDSTIQGRSWVVANINNASPNLTNLGANDAVGVIGSGGDFGGANLAGNWLIRAEGNASGGRPVNLD